MIYWIIIILGGVLFIYFNFRISCKFNLTASFIKIKICYRLFKKNHVKDKKFYYVDYFKKNKKRFQDIKAKKYYPYLKHLKRVTHLFIVKNIYLYPECLDDSSSFVVEFTVVNNILKRPILKG